MGCMKTLLFGTVRSLHFRYNNNKKKNKVYIIKYIENKSHSQSLMAPKKQKPSRKSMEIHLFNLADYLSELNMHI
jgi:hypothetical protein